MIVLLSLPLILITHTNPQVCNSGLWGFGLGFTVQEFSVGPGFVIIGLGCLGFRACSLGCFP